LVKRDSGVAPKRLRISCGSSTYRPRKPTFQSAVEELTARAELSARPAVDCMRGLDGASLQSEAPNVGRELRELRLIELVATPI
jgi:hypothetical protein